MDINVGLHDIYKKRLNWIKFYKIYFYYTNFDENEMIE